MKSVQLVEKEDITRFLQQSSMGLSTFLNIIGMDYSKYMDIMNGEIASVLFSGRIIDLMASREYNPWVKHTIIIQERPDDYLGYFEDNKEIVVTGTGVEDVMDKLKEAYVLNKKNGKSAINS